MWRFFRWFFTGDGHKHFWEAFEESDITREGRLKGKIWILKCKHCGALKEFRSNV